MKINSLLIFFRKLLLIFTFTLIIFLPFTAVKAINPCECCCPSGSYTECEPNGAYESTDCTSAGCCNYCSAKGEVSDSSCPLGFASTPVSSSSAAGTTWEKADKIYYLLEAPIGSTLYVDGIAQYITLLYDLASSAAAIIAVVVIMFGGFMWATSAGNEQRITSAKETIISAVVGLILVLGSYVILNFINPQIVSLGGLDILKIPLADIAAETTSASMNCSWTVLGVSGTTRVDDKFCTSPKPPAETRIDADTGAYSSLDYSCYCSSKCAPATSGPCSVDNLSKTCFGANAWMASRICKAESGGSAASVSKSDYCSDDPQKRAFSFGLFQINIRANDVDLSTGGTETCHSNFTGYSVAGATYKCQITDTNVYNKCRSDVLDINNNIKTACRLSGNGAHWQPWTTNNMCGFPK